MKASMGGMAHVRGVLRQAPGAGGVLTVDVCGCCGGGGRGFPGGCREPAAEARAEEQVRRHAGSSKRACDGCNRTDAITTRGVVCKGEAVRSR
jgi:hypothetical protein